WTAASTSTAGTRGSGNSRGRLRCSPPSAGTPSTTARPSTRSASDSTYAPGYGRRRSIDRGELSPGGGLVVDQDRGARDAGARLPTRAEKQAASWAGWFMAITFVTSIPALLLYHPVLHDHSYILGPGHDTRIELAALLEVVLAISGIGVAVVMFPILRRESERLALGYVASRIVESTMICVGLVSLLSVL